MASRGAIAKVLVVLGTAYPRFEMPSGTASVYADLLHDISDDLLIAAAKHHATTSKWFPSVAELRQSAFDIQAQSQGIPSPGEAWAEVMREMRRVGSWSSPEFTCDLIARGVDAMGGWSMLCASENMVADRAHFLKIYGSFLERHEKDAAMLPEIREMIQDLSARMDAPQLEEGDHEDNA